jgi:hypothetical protein
VAGAARVRVLAVAERGAAMSAGHPLTRERFAQLVMARLRTRGAAQIEYQAETFSIGWREGQNRAVLNLANAHQRACAVPPPEVAKVIDHYLGLQQSAPPAGAGYEAAAARLMPVVRDVRYFSIAMLQLRHADLGAEVPQVPFRTLAGEVVLALFTDAERSMAQVSQAQLRDWGVGFEEALARAMRNLQARSAPSFSKQADGLYASAWKDDYDSSRLLLPELLASLPIRGEPVAAIPTRNHLLVAGARDSGALRRLAQATVKILDSEPRPMTAQLLRYGGGQWSACDDPAASIPALREAHFKLLLRDYAQQKDLLEAILRREQKDLFVATLQAFNTREGTVSLAQWTKNVDTLLPKADRLALLDMETREMLIVAWEQAAPLLGAALQPQGLHPERYLVSGYPDKRQLEQLRGVALTKAKV